MSIIDEIKNGRKDFLDVDLRRANLRRADLRHVNLRYVNLRGINLGGAYLRGADLEGADLEGANLEGANLREANLEGANLHDAVLRRANLERVNFLKADLRGADLREVNLLEANLKGVNLREANLPAPTIVLLANWGRVSAELTLLLMRYDSQNHPNPKLFDTWAVTNDAYCPYAEYNIQRCANFHEVKKFWSPGPTYSAFELMRRVIKEKCKNSDYHDQVK